MKLYNVCAYELTNYRGGEYIDRVGINKNSALTLYDNYEDAKNEAARVLNELLTKTRVHHKNAHAVKLGSDGFTIKDGEQHWIASLGLEFNLYDIIIDEYNYTLG